MGTMTLPASGVLCINANIVIYTVEKHPRYSSAFRPLWSSVAAGQVYIVVSELVLLETLVGPYRAGLQQLANDYETFFTLPGIELIPISPSVLREAAAIRANVSRLRSPDAIHAATAILHSSANLLTNDLGFRNLAQLNILLLDELMENKA